MDLFGLSIPLPVAEIMVLIAALDIILGVMSKHTPWKWDDNLYSIVHTLVAKLPLPGRK